MRNVRGACQARVRLDLDFLVGAVDAISCHLAEGARIMGCLFLVVKLGVWGLILLFAFVVLFGCPPGLYD